MLLVPVAYRRALAALTPASGATPDGRGVLAARPLKFHMASRVEPLGSPPVGLGVPVREAVLVAVDVAVAVLLAVDVAVPVLGAVPDGVPLLVAVPVRVDVLLAVAVRVAEVLPVPEGV